MVFAVLAGVLRADIAPEGIAFPQYGLLLKGPVGWAGRLEAGKDYVVGWNKFDPDDHNLRAAIVIRATPNRDKGTLRQHAIDTCNAVGGRIVDGLDLSIDGAPALRIEADQNRHGVAIRGAIVTLHDNVCYTLVVASILNEPLDEMVNGLIASWRWIPIASPADGSTYVPGVRLLGDVLALPLPAGMGLPGPSGNWNEPAASVTLELTNLAAGRDDLRLVVSVDAPGPGESLDALRDRHLSSLRDRSKRQRLEWHRDPDRPVRQTTPFVSISPASGNVVSHERLASIETADGRLVLLRFQILTPSEKDRMAYERRADYMFNELVLFHRPKADSGSR